MFWDVYSRFPYQDVFVVGSNGFFVSQIGLGDMGLIEISRVLITVLLSFFWPMTIKR